MMEDDGEMSGEGVGGAG